MKILQQKQNKKKKISTHTKDYKTPKSSFTISIPKNLHTRISAIRSAIKPLNKKVSFSSELLPVLYDIVSELENQYVVSKKCSRCNSKMTLRSGKHSDFYGCSSYPKCKHTEKL